MELLLLVFNAYWQHEQKLNKKTFEQKQRTLQRVVHRDIVSLV